MFLRLATVPHQHCSHLFLICFGTFLQILELYYGKSMFVFVVCNTKHKKSAKNYQKTRELSLIEIVVEFPAKKCLQIFFAKGEIID